MEPELLAHYGEVVVVRVAQVKPDGDGAFSQVIADVGDRKPFELEPAVPVQPGTRLAPGRAYPADGGRRQRVRILVVEGLPGQRPGPQPATTGSRRPCGFAWRWGSRFLAPSGTGAPKSSWRNSAPERSEREQVGALGQQPVAAGRAAHAPPQPGTRVLPDPAGVLAARGQPRRAPVRDGGGSGGRRYPAVLADRDA